MCDFCCSKHQLDIHTKKDAETKTEEYVYIDKNVLTIEIYSDIKAFSTVITETIHFCPMCGRKL